MIVLAIGYLLYLMGKSRGRAEGVSAVMRGYTDALTNERP